MTIQTTAMYRDGALQLPDGLMLPAEMPIDVVITLPETMTCADKEAAALAAFRAELEPLLFDDATPHVPADFGSDYIYIGDK